MTDIAPAGADCPECMGHADDLQRPRSGWRPTGGPPAFTVEHLHCLDPALKPIVGYARTATIRAVEPSPLPPDAVKAKRAAYYEYVAAEPARRWWYSRTSTPIPGSARSGAR